MREERQCRRAPWGFLAAAALISLFGVADVSAQRFEYAYGSANCIETGLHGVLQRGVGGYVAVGESFIGAGGACANTSNAYVAVTNAAGAQIWSRTYLIGTNSRATDVLELGNGELVVCGYASIAAPCNPAGVSQDIFLMRLAPNGNVIAVNTYGGPTTDEQAWQLVRATVGGAGVAVGDYIVAGWSTNQNAAGMRGGYLLRTTAGLALIWDQQYGTAPNDDYFLGVDEVPAGMGGAGDIVAVGGSTSPPAVNRDVFLVRVNGTNGTIGAAPQGQSLTNFPPAANNSSDEGRAVIVLRNGPNAGDLVVAGFTNGAPMPSVNEEAWVIEFGPNPCVQVGNVYFGDNGPLPDRANNLVEDANPPAGVASAVVVTGFTNIPGGFGQEDVFLHRVSTGAGIGLIGAGGVYGGQENDRGGAVANATRIVANSETLGYIINGFTESNNLIGADPRQLYLLKTGTGLRTMCNDVLLDFPSGHAQNGTVCVNMIGPNIGLQCVPGIQWIAWNWANLLCYNFPKMVPQGGDESEATMSFNEGRITSYPNPLRSGDVVNLRFELNEEATARVVVSDITGRETYRDDVVMGEGTQVVPLATNGWTAGTYMVRVTVDGVTATSQIVVLEK